MQTRVVGLMGRKRSGKDTVGQFLVEDHGFQRLAFADILKEVALEIDPWIDWSSGWDPMIDRLSSIVQIEGWDKAKEDHPEVRRFLQELGLAVRHQDPDFWVRPIMDKLVPGGSYVITDVRFPNEFRAVAGSFPNHPFVPVVLARVVRPGLDESDRHESETALDNYVPNWIIRNEGDLAELRGSVTQMIQSIHGA